jgi:hypothetical protein
MIRRTSDLKGCAIRAVDGSIGNIVDLLFQEQDWTIRWAVVDTGTWIPGRQVLLPPSVLGPLDGIDREIPVDLTREQVKGSLGVETDEPVSRRREAEVYSYYGWDPYWGGGVGYAPVSQPVGAAGVVPPPAGARYPRPVAPDAGDPNLRSIDEVTGYYVKATDGDIGHVEDFLVDEENWRVRYLVVDTKNWWPGKKVLVSPDWVQDVSWSEQKAFVALTREKVKNSPEYRPESAIDRDYEQQLYGYYGYPIYWGAGTV